MNDYQKMLEYIKVEEILNRRNTREVKEIKFERTQTVCLRRDQIIRSIRGIIQTIYDRVINVDN